MGGSTRTGGGGPEGRGGTPHETGAPPDTGSRLRPDAPRPEPARSAAFPPGARSRERARARAYLDLWERHLVESALNGPEGHPLPSHPQPPRR